MENQEFLISKTDQGFVASSTSSPYFCFVESTEAAAVNTVRRALAFYNEARSSEGAADRMVVSKPVKVTPLIPGRRMFSRELLVA